MENNREIAIRLSGVKKRYKLGQIGGGTLTADLQSWWARVRGKEDPNVMIGMLCTAIEGGWQGVQLPKGSTPAKPPREEREYKCV